MFSNKRQTAIEYSVQFEQNVSSTLCYLLGIDFSNSKAFGFGSSSLSFQNKLTLLRDINAIDKRDKEKFDHFSAIRNQFAHNKDAVDFKSCFDFLKDMDKKLRNLYSDKIDSTADIEIQCESLFNNLYEDLIAISDKFLQALFEKGFAIGEKDGLVIFKEALLDTIKEFKLKSEENKALLGEILKITQEKIDVKTTSPITDVRKKFMR